MGFGKIKVGFDASAFQELETPVCQSLTNLTSNKRTGDLEAVEDLGFEEQLLVGREASIPAVRARI